MNLSEQLFLEQGPTMSKNRFVLELEEIYPAEAIAAIEAEEAQEEEPDE